MIAAGELGAGVTARDDKIVGVVVVEIDSDPTTFAPDSETAFNWNLLCP